MNKLEEAFIEEIKYWLQELVNENSRDAIGKQAKIILDNEDKIKEIAHKLLNDNEDLWAEIHMQIEHLAGIYYR